MVMKAILLQTDFSESSFSKDELVPDCKTQPTQTTQPIPLIQRTQPSRPTEPTEPTQPTDQVEKIVRFEPHHQIIEIPHLSDLSDDEIDDIWMSRDDFRAIRRECKTIVLMISRKRSLLKNVELRGLENYVISERNEIEKFKNLMYDTVEKLMSFVDETSMDVTNLLAEMCGKISAKSEYKARQIALQDEKDAIALV